MSVLGKATDHEFVELPALARAMKVAAAAFLAGLEADQQRRCLFAVGDEERLNWDYRPVPRAGIALAELDSAQKYRALALCAAGLSRGGMATALNIMSLERILGALEAGAGGHERDPDRYFVSLFGRPELDPAWGWRLEGHHLSVNFLIAADRFVSCCPNFFGANPATVPSGPLRGFRTLPREEAAARHLLSLLSEEQARRAVISEKPPPDIVTDSMSRVRLDEPVGLAVSELGREQRTAVVELLDVYLSRMAPRLRDAEMEAADREGLGAIHFAWAGSSREGEPHYYRLHGPGLVVEYDNVQNEANHIHSVWRNLKRDWGVDLLREHYDRSHAPAGSS